MSAAALLQFIRIRPRTFLCTYSKKRGTRPTLSAVLHVHSSISWSPIPQLLPLPSPVSSPREVERPFEICRWPKDASRTVLVWPRIRDSYLLTESSRKEGVIERPYHLRTSSAVTAGPRACVCVGRLRKIFTTEFFATLTFPSFSLSFCYSPWKNIYMFSRYANT